MQKAILHIIRPFILIIVIFFTTESQAQGLFYAQNASMNVNNTDSCTGFTVTVNTWLGCINFSVSPATFSVSGNTINVDVNCTSSPICAGAISQPVFGRPVTGVSPGTYTVVANAFLDRTLANSITVGSVVISNCTTTGITDLNSQELRIGPNPSNGLIQIDGLSNIQNYQYRVFDYSGKLIKTGRLENNSISILGQSAGLYFLELSNGIQSIQRKVILQ